MFESMIKIKLTPILNFHESRRQQRAIPRLCRTLRVYRPVVFAMDSRDALPPWRAQLCEELSKLRISHGRRFQPEDACTRHITAGPQKNCRHGSTTKITQLTDAFSQTYLNDSTRTSAGS